MPLQAERLPAADTFLRYLCHFDAAKVDLSGPDPKKSAVKHSPLDLVRRVPDEAATLSLAKGNFS